MQKRLLVLDEQVCARRANHQSSLETRPRVASGLAHRRPTSEQGVPAFRDVEA
jgi:hypothetical protein